VLYSHDQTQSTSVDSSVEDSFSMAYVVIYFCRIHNGRILPHTVATTITTALRHDKNSTFISF